MKKWIRKVVRLEKPSLVQEDYYYELLDDGVDEEVDTERIRIDEPNK